MGVVTLSSSLWPTRGWRSVEGLLRFSFPVRPVEHRFPGKELVALLVSVTSDRWADGRWNPYLPMVGSTHMGARGSRWKIQPWCPETFQQALSFPFSARILFLYYFLVVQMSFKSLPIPVVSMLVTEHEGGPYRYSVCFRRHIPSSGCHQHAMCRLTVFSQMNFVFRLFNRSCPLTSPRFCRTQMGIFRSDDLWHLVFSLYGFLSTYMSSFDQKPSRFYFYITAPESSSSQQCSSYFLLNKFCLIRRTTTFSRKNTGCPTTFEFQRNSEQFLA